MGHVADDSDSRTVDLAVCFEDIFSMMRTIAKFIETVKGMSKPSSYAEISVEEAERATKNVLESCKSAQKFIERTEKSSTSEVYKTAIGQLKRKLETANAQCEEDVRTFAELVILRDQVQKKDERLDKAYGQMQQLRDERELASWTSKKLSAKVEHLEKDIKIAQEEHRRLLGEVTNLRKQVNTNWKERRSFQRHLVPAKSNRAYIVKLRKEKCVLKEENEKLENELLTTKLHAAECKDNFQNEIQKVCCVRNEALSRCEALRMESDGYIEQRDRLVGKLRDARRQERSLRSQIQAVLKRHPLVRLYLLYDNA